MTDVREQALRAALLKVITERLGDAKKVAHTEISDTWQEKDRTTAVLPGRRVLGTVTLASGKTTAKVADQAAYEKWVRETHPGEFVEITVRQVRPEFTTRILSAARQLGTAVDAETGELVPGVDVVKGDPHPMVRLDSEALALVAEAWQSGELAELVGGLLRPAIADGS